MINRKPISQLLPIISVDGNDVLPINDVNDDSQSPVGSTKKISMNQIKDFVDSGNDWTVVTSGPVTLVSDLGYIANGLSMITFNLPSTANVGDVFRVEGMGSGLFQINQNSGQQIRVGSLITTVGVSGNIVSTNVGDSIEILCIEDNVLFKVRSGYVGTPDVN